MSPSASNLGPDKVELLLRAGSRVIVQPLSSDEGIHAHDEPRSSAVQVSTSTASVISASEEPAARASSASVLTPSGWCSDGIGDHAHENLVLGWNGAVIQDPLAHLHVQLHELRIVRLDWLKPWSEQG